MGRWQVQEAKQRFSEVLRKAQEDGPQIVTKHGEDIAVVLNMNEYRRVMASDNGAFMDFLVTMPELPEEALQRSEEPSWREIDFED